MNVKSTISAPKPRTWLLAKSRQWHRWGGLMAGIFLLIIGTSGIVLNYKQPIFTALGIDLRGGKSDGKAGGGRGERGAPSKSKITTGAGLTALPVGLERALELARNEWGDVPVERIEIASQRGEVTYKLRQKTEDELWVSATTGDYFAKGEYERIGKAGADGQPVRSTDWSKILLDLHTGRIGGDLGKAVMTCAAVLLLLLTFSGIYMWVKPIMLRRQNAPVEG